MSETSPYTSWPSLIDDLKDNQSSASPSGGTPGQILISNGSAGAIWSTLLRLSIPDNTQYGGNVRGTDSIDLQLSRDAATEVTSGNYSVIVGGAGNTNSDDYSSIVGGNLNSGTGGQYNFIGGGQGNQLITCTYSIIGAGYATTIDNSNYAVLVGGYQNYIYQGDYAFIGAGSENEADYDYSLIVCGQECYVENFSTVINGLINEATGLYAYVGSGTQNESYGPYSHINNGSGQYCVGEYGYIGNGYQNSSNSNYATIVNGSNNNVDGQYCTILNGSSNNVYGSYSTVINGQCASDKGRTGWVGYSTGCFSQNGDQQAWFTILSGSGTTTDTIILTSGNAPQSYTAPGAYNVVNLSPFTVLHIKGIVLASDTSTQDSGAWSIEFVIKQSGSASTTAIVGTPTITTVATDTAFSSVQIAVSADTTNGGVAISASNILGVSNGWANLTYVEASLTVTELAIPFN